MASRSPSTLEFLVAAVLGLAACRTGGTTDQTIAPQLPRIDVVVSVVSVADGDSFRAASPDGELEVRLLGINSPERDECWGPEAAQRLRDLILDREVGLALEPVPDQFDRVLARAVLDDVYVNLVMAANGDSLALSGATVDRDRLLAAEESARLAGIGIWAEDICGASGPRPSLKIVAIDFDPAGADEIEVLTIENTGLDLVDLGGFTLRDESSANRFEFPAISLEPGERIEILSTECKPIRPPGVTWCTEQPIWNNDGDTALLLDRVGRIVTLRRY